jgi:tight adherence protein B
MGDVLGRSLLVAVFAGVGVLAVVIGTWVLVSRRRLAEEAALRARLARLSPSAEAEELAIIRDASRSLNPLDRLLAGRSFAAVIEEETARAGLGWSAGRFALYVLLGLGVGALATLVLPRAAAVLVGLACSLLPFVVVSSARRKRERAIEEQLPDAVDMLVNALRAGYSLQAAMQFVGSELPAPVGPEFARFHDEQRLGVDVRQALEGLQERLGTLDGRMLVLAMIIQRESGGNLGEVLGNIADIIRERINFRGQVAVLTAEGKLSAVFLTVLPLLLFVLMQALNPTYTAQLTSTSLGQFLLVYAAVSLVLGYVVLRRIADIEV